MTNKEIISLLIEARHTKTQKEAQAIYTRINACSEDNVTALRASQFLEGWIASWGERENHPEQHSNAIAYFTEGVCAGCGYLPKDLK